MNILFLIPPADLARVKTVVDRVYGCNYGYDYKPAVHFLISATVLQRYGCMVRFLDCPAEGITAKKFIKELGKDKFDIVVFFTTWLSSGIDLQAGGIVFEKLKNVKVVFMGPYPTWKPELFLINDDYFVVRGEPEETLVDLISFMESSRGKLREVRGLSFLENGKINHNPHRGLLEIDSLPIPNRKLLKGRYFLNRVEAHPSTVMCTSRGCFYECTYCAPHALDQAIELEHSRNNLPKPASRLRNAQNVINEFRKIASEGFKGIEICDNQFIWDRERTFAICQAIKPLKMEWICYARADHLKDKDLLKLIKEAGCKLIYIGTESFDQKILDDIHKQCVVAEYFSAVNAVKNAGIEAEVSVLLGASGLETQETISKSIQEARTMNAHFVHYSIALPFPNTALYKIAKEKGWIAGGEFYPVDNARDGILNLPFVKADALKKMLKRCYIRQYLSVGFIFKEVIKIRSFDSLAHKVKAFTKFISYILNFSKS